MENQKTAEDALLKQLRQAADLESLEKLRIEILGKKGILTQWMKALGTLSGDARRTQGERLNHFKSEVLSVLEESRRTFEQQALNSRLDSEFLDVTLPCESLKPGRIHPLTQATAEIISIFEKIGFTVMEGPDIEDAWHNFTALNVPSHHPARSVQDTFYFSSPLNRDESLLLRTHTSPVQIRTLKTHTPPLRILVPGRVFRADYDQTHTPMFHQIEGLVIEKGIHMGHLKGCLEDFCHLFFDKKDLPIRFRPSFFPFTEPSAEVDIGCYQHQGQLRIGRGSTKQDWLEVLGCGMVHPRVLKNCGLDPDIYQGFAFGMGVERLSMLKYGIPDLRSFFENDQRWLAHYGFLPEEGKL